MSETRGDHERSVAQTAFEAGPTERPPPDELEPAAPPCPDPSCHGSLDTDRDPSRCSSCHVSRAGVYYPPEEGAVEDWCGYSPTRPTPAQVSDERERYDNSGDVILVGGFEDAYPEERTTTDDNSLLAE